MSLFRNREQAGVIGGRLGRLKKIDAFVKWRGWKNAHGAREIAGAVGEGGTIDKSLELAMNRSALIAAVCAGLPVQTAVCQEAFQITNITIKMMKHSGRGNFRIDAKITNPNDFAVFDVRVDCDIRDRRGKKLVSYGSTIVDAIQAKEVRTIRRLDIGAWPDQGRTAYCQSSKAKRLPDR